MKNHGPTWEWTSSPSISASGLVLFWQADFQAAACVDVGHPSCRRVQGQKVPRNRGNSGKKRLAAFGWSVETAAALFARARICSARNGLNTSSSLTLISRFDFLYSYPDVYAASRLHQALPSLVPASPRPVWARCTYVGAYDRGRE
jgi:hypothetical protein